MIKSISPSSFVKLVLFCVQCPLDSLISHVLVTYDIFVLFRNEHKQRNEDGKGTGKDEECMFTIGDGTITIGDGTITIGDGTITIGDFGIIIISINIYDRQYQPECRFYLGLSFQDTDTRIVSIHIP